VGSSGEADETKPQLARAGALDPCLLNSPAHPSNPSAPPTPPPPLPPTRPAAAEWERDGLNLRLEIGICSVDDSEEGEEEGEEGEEPERSGNEEEGSSGAEEGGSSGEESEEEGSSGSGGEEEEGGGAPPAKRARRGGGGDSSGSPGPLVLAPPRPARGRLDIVAASGVAAGNEVGRARAERCWDI
jgi:hypothetical protein